MATVIEVDCSTGISTEREQTAEEVAAMAAMAAMAAQAEADRVAKEAADAASAAAKESGAAKLAALGLTAEEIAAFFNN
jgi:hypothetical protein